MRGTLEEAFHDAVFERVETDDGKAPLGSKQASGGVQGGAQLLELAVHLDANRLEGSRRGMLAHVLFVARHDRGNEVRKVPRRRKGLFRAPRDDRPGDRAREALFAVEVDHASDGLLIGRIEPFRGRHARRRIHAHVERPLETEGKSARSVVDLRGGNADVEKDSVHLARRNAEARKLFDHR